MVEPVSPVPYQAYRSKRSSGRIVSNNNAHLVPNVEPPPSLSRPTSIVGTPSNYGVLLAEKEPQITLSFPADDTFSPSPVVILNPSPPQEPVEPIKPEPVMQPETAVSFPTASSSSSPPATKRASTFRFVPRTSRAPLPSSLLGGTPTHSRHVSMSERPSPENPELHGRTMSFNSGRPRSVMSPKSPLATQPPTETIHFEPDSPPPEPVSPPVVSPTPVAPVPFAPRMVQSPSTTSSPVPSHPSSPAPVRHPPAPYRPGFQPKGVYRPRTDEFISLRQIARDGDPTLGMEKRIERTKLERRLEKLIALHFPVSGQARERPPPRARTSSFFDLSDLRRLSIADAGDLWKGVLSSAASSKDTVRAAEQRITPWQEDVTVSKCPLCSTSFHPLTNRKHHCRLCGQIVCSLPIKRPHRPVLCSVLFVVNPTTRRIEEVGEGVDYGVKKRRPASIGNAAALASATATEDETEKFLKGVRICNDCRPVLLRQQYQQEIVAIPAFVKLYEAFTILEKELEDSLPQFQELLLSLNQDETPTKEAAAARKRLLEVFAQYDALAKRIRKLPCPQGSSQDRIQMAVMTRANLFLQKHMFPLQSLPKHTPGSKGAATAPAEPEPPLVDPDSEVALALQPLLEQEALLESFVAEATAQRKFEDAKTLRTNLQEIRAEIERIMANAGASSDPRKRRKA
ncbi:FYVE zinc finger-domain-containing protein [Mycena floridula]|nr:FYVE zinc finger-domain-containing protein [Mycena floridula]